MNKKILIGYVLILVLFIGFLVYYFFEKHKYENILVLEKPVWPSSYETFGDLKEWQMRYFQPQLKEFRSGNNLNYLLVEYPDANNRILEAKVLLTGKIEDNENTEIFFIDKNERKNISFEELKQKLVIGEQIQVKYLDKAPYNFMEHKLCQLDPKICLAGQMMNGETELVIGRIIGFESKDFENKVIPGLSIATELYEK